MTCSRKPLKIDGGATYIHVLRWGTDPLNYKAITAVTDTSPLTVTCPAHGVVSGWSVALNGFAAPFDSLNATHSPPEGDEFTQAVVVDANTLSFPNIDAENLGDYSHGGSVIYYTPVSLAGSPSGTFNVYTTPAATAGPQTPVLSVAGVFDDALKTITFTMTDVQSATLVDGQYTFAVIIVGTGGTPTDVIDEGSLLVKFPGT